MRGISTSPRPRQRRLARKNRPAKRSAPFSERSTRIASGAAPPSASSSLRLSASAPALGARARVLTSPSRRSPRARARPRRRARRRAGASSRRATTTPPSRSPSSVAAPAAAAGERHPPHHAHAKRHASTSVSECRREARARDARVVRMGLWCHLAWHPSWHPFARRQPHPRELAVRRRRRLNRAPWRPRQTPSRRGAGGAAPRRRPRPSPSAPAGCPRSQRLRTQDQGAVDSDRIPESPPPRARPPNIARGGCERAR